MRPLSGRHAVGGFKITTLGRGGFASRVLRVVRHERRTSLTASLGCWHAYPVGVSAVLTLAPGSSPWRLQSAHGGTPAYVTDGDGRAGMRRARSAVMACSRSWFGHGQCDPDRMICVQSPGSPLYPCSRLSPWGARVARIFRRVRVAGLAWPCRRVVVCRRGRVPGRLGRAARREAGRILDVQSVQ